ncbi:unnamed protein product [Trichobilharzia szidati]|nr:unnamed protein product [Trichobilharzia szidati]
MNWLVCASAVDWSNSPLDSNDGDDEFYEDDYNNQLKQQYPFTAKRYMTVAEEKKFWNKLFSGIRTAGPQRFTPPRGPSTLRFG